MFFVFAALFLGRFVRPKIHDAEKSSVYECGERPIGSAWFTFNPRFYLLALVFIVFDVAIALVFPVAVVFKSHLHAGTGVIAAIGLLGFLMMLVFGLAFVWGHGNLEWVRDIDEPEHSEEQK
jgi:NADH-quinone oxidoreductase subunit A